MKYIIGFIVIVSSLFTMTSCQRDKYYTCMCNIKDSAFIEHTIGRQRKDIAYAQCKAFADSSTSCTMEVRK